MQHFVFCRRQWALIHLENQWKENLRTVEGQLLHTHAHDATSRERRGNTLILRGVSVVSHTLGISGQCDVVEFHMDDHGVLIHGESGAVLLSEECRRNFLKDWQERKKDILTHPFLGEKLPLGLLPYIQALLLTRYLRGDLDAYPPFLWK